MNPHSKKRDLFPMVLIAGFVYIGMQLVSFAYHTAVDHFKPGVYEVHEQCGFKPRAVVNWEYYIEGKVPLNAVMRVENLMSFTEASMIDCLTKRLPQFWR